MAGDSLARGAKSATFGPPKISQERWDAIWADDSSTKKTEANLEILRLSLPKLKK